MSGMGKIDERAAAEERERATYLLARARELVEIAEELEREARRISECADQLTAPA